MILEQHQFEKICRNTDFVVNRFFMKLFKTNNRDAVSYCRMQFNVELPTALA